MATQRVEDGAPASSQPPARQPLTPAQVREVAEKVYQLLLAELRMERARGAHRPRGR